MEIFRTLTANNTFLAQVEDMDLVIQKEFTEDNHAIRITVSDKATATSFVVEYKDEEERDNGFKELSATFIEEPISFFSTVVAGYNPPT